MTDTPIRIGFCTDLSGPFEGVDGAAGAESIRWAIAEMGGSVAGRRVELLLGDHRNDIAEAAAIVRAWCDEDVDMIVSGVNSDTSLAITGEAAARGVPVFVVGAGTSVQTRERASPYVVQYAYSTLGVATAAGLGVTERGGSPWFFVTADYPFGSELQAHASAAIQAAGGQVAGSVVNPHGETDFAAFIAAARDSGAAVVGIANAHTELVAAVDAIAALGLRERMTAVGLFTLIEDIHHMGLERAQGLYLVDSWFWTLDAEARDWAERFLARHGRMPTSIQAADYSAALQYLKAVDAAGTAEPGAVLAALQDATFDDMYVKGGRLRDDGTMIHDLYLLQVKTAAASREPWDYYDLVAEIPGDDAFPRT